ncbi:MAG: hypothetical protein ACXVCO_07845 [Ktedonobacterales bacterium]
MSINAFQLLVIVLVITGAIGVRRGWQREVITTAILLSTLAFLSLGGAAFILHFFSQGFVSTASAHALSGGGPDVSTGSASGGGGSTPQTPLACIETGAQSLSNFIFIGMTWLGYWAGSKHGQPPKNGTHRLAGIVPGAINGAVIMYYVSHAGLLASQVVVESPSATSVSTFLPIVLALGLVGLLAVLFVASQGHKSKAAN